jgi:hypothetical protein
MDECVHFVNEANQFSLTTHICYQSHSHFDPVEGLRIERITSADTPVDQAWNSVMFWIHVAECPRMLQTRRRSAGNSQLALLAADCNR